MSPIEQLKKKLKDLANQGSNVFSQKIVSPVPQRKPIQPQDNIVSQFGRSSVGKAISGFQKNIEQRTLPKVNLQPQVNRIQNPTVRTVAGFGASIAQDAVNLPQRLLEGGGRIGMQIVRPMQEGRQVNARQAVGAVASAAEPIFDIATAGSGIAFKQAAKQGFKVAAKQGAKKAVLRGVGTGAAYGATFGGLRGLSEGNEASFRKGVEGAAQGAVAGGVFGGITAGAGGLVGLIRKTPEVEKQLRDSMGRWTRGATPVKPKGMTKPQWDFQLEFNQKYKRNPYTPVYADDVKKAVGYEVERRGAGLSIRDINKDKNPLGTQKLRVKPQVQIKKEVGGVSDIKQGYDNWKVATPDDLINKPLKDFLPIKKQEGTAHTYDFFDKQGNKAGQVSYMLDAKNGAITITGIKSKTAGTGAGTNIVQGLKRFAEINGLKLTVTDAEKEALPYWAKQGVEIRSYFPGASPLKSNTQLGTRKLKIKPQPQIQKEVGGSILLKEANKRGYKSSNPLANIEDVKIELMDETYKAKNFMSEMVNKYASRTSKTKSVRDLMTPSEIKTMNDLNAKSDKAYNLLKSESSPLKSNTVQKEVGGFKKGEEVGFAGILSPKGEARKGKFVRKVNENLVEIDYGDHKELNHINNIYKLGRKDLNFLEANPLNQSLQGAKPQAQIQKEVGGYDIASEPRVQGQMRGLTEKGRQMTIDAERSRRPVISEPDMPYILKRAGASPEDIASGKITVYRATENGRILPGDFVTPDKSVLKPYFDQRVETGRNPKIITQKVDVKDLVIGDEVTDFVYRPQSPLKSQPNVAKPLLSDISKTTSTPQHNLKMAKESGRSFEDLLKDSPEMLKGRTGFDTPPQTVKVYRGVSQEGRNIRSGDWVTTNPEYAKKYGGVVQELEVSAKDLKYMNGSAQGNAMGEFPEYIYTGKFSGQKPVSPLGLTVGESNVGSVGNTTPEILVKNPPTKEVFHNPIVPQKQFTQLGSATNTRADQIAPKLRKPAPFEVEMDAQVGKPYEKPFKGRSKLKLKEPTKLPGDQATADFATARAAMGGNGVKGLPKETSDQFQKWVNTRRATQLEGVLKKKEYADLNNKGIEGIFEFQSGNKTGRYGDVKKYFDTKYKTLQDNKIEFDFRQDYLPQLWNNTPEEIQQVMGRRMGMKPSFTLDAVFKSYKEGIDAGLTPKFQNISDLVGWYEQKANKAIADKNFFDFLGKDGTILPSTKAPMDWVTLDPDRFPKFLTQIADEKFAGTYKAPKEVADVINGYLRDPQMPLLEKVANYVSGVKSIALNFGIPGTAINAHGINILARHSLMGTGGNPISRFVKGAHFMLDQRSAGKMLDKQMVNAPKAMKDGLMLSSDDYSNRIIEATGLKQKFGKKWEEVFGGPLFNKMLPSLKLSSYEELVKNGMDGKDAAKLVNNVYGGINWEQMGRSKDIQNLLRIAILAPDWAETTLRTGGNFVKALNPKDRSMVMNRYRTMMATILGSYVAHNIANKLTSGHYSFENEPSNIFNIQVGYTEDGEKRYIRPYGTGLDMVRLPAEVAMGLFKGDLTGVTRLLRNRLSIPAGVVVGALTDQDYRGNAIGWRGTDKFGNEMPMGQRAMNIGTEMASLVGLPSFIKQFGMSATGQQSLEAGLTQGFELPTRYQNPGKSKTQEYVGKVSELKGKDLYDLKTRFKGESPFSDNQKAVINQGGLPALEQVMQLREQKRQVNKSKDIQEQVVNGEITEEEGRKALEEILKTSAPVTQKKVDSTNKAYASDTVAGSFSEDIAKNRVKLTKKSERLGNKIIYPTEDGTGTIDLTPPTKGTGIGAYANKDWNITKARSIWNNDSLTQEDKDYAFKKLGVKPEDVRYDALANYDVDIKAQYLSSKSTTKERLIENIKTGRKRSVGDLVFASDGVIDAMVDEGRLTKEEAKELKAIDYDKSGKLKIKAGGKGRKLKIGSTPTMKAINIGTPSKMAQVSFAKRSPKLQLKARPAKIKVKLKKLQAKRQKASKLKIKSLKSANV